MTSSVIPWYFSMQLLFAAALPLTFSVCTRLPDRGYAAAKALGLILATYLSWLLANGIMHFGYWSVLAGAGITAIVSIISLKRNSYEFGIFLRTRGKLILLYEVLFAGTFLLFVLFRAQVPHISWNLTEPLGNFWDMAAEKFTDFAVLNSLLTSSGKWPSFPPQDAWLAGETLNYYYFGHLLWASMIEFSRVLPEVGFNLGLASIFAYVSLLSFSIGYNLTRQIRWALLTMFLITLSSNVDGLFQLIGIVFERILSDPGEHYLSTLPKWYRTYDFWRSSRSIAGTINEFPAFSFILGDLHAHLSSLVVFLTGLLLAIQLWLGSMRYRSLVFYEMRHWDLLFFIALIIGCLSAANSWDVVTYGGFVGVALWSARYRSIGNTKPDMWQRFAWPLEALLVTAFLILVGVGLLFYNFQLFFQSPLSSHGALKLVAPENRSSTIEFLMHWVLMAAAPFILLGAVMLRQMRVRGMLTRGRVLTMLAVIAATSFVAFPLVEGWLAVLLPLLAAGICLFLIIVDIPATVRLLAGILFLFLVLSGFCELFYLDDIFSGSIERINTVFKIYYGLWSILAIATVLATKRLVRWSPLRIRARRSMFFVGGLVLAGGVYPVLGTVQRIAVTWSGHAKNAKDLTARLDGLAYMRVYKPDDYAAVKWLRARTPKTAKILEAAGSQYTYSGRISTMTGRPALAGWLMHEYGWRGERFNEERAAREKLTGMIYGSADSAFAFEELKKHDIDYVIVGEEERSRYPDIDEEKFGKFCDLVFESGDTEILQVRKDTSLAGLKMNSAAQRLVKRLPQMKVPDFSDTPGTTPENLPITDRNVFIDEGTPVPLIEESTTASQQTSRAASLGKDPLLPPDNAPIFGDSVTRAGTSVGSGDVSTSSTLP